MGKSIVHCAVCGEAIREEDFTARRAASIDHRTYCSKCIPAGRAPAPSPGPRSGSTARVPLATPGTRRSVGGPRGKSAIPIVAGISAAVLLLAVGAFALFRGGEKPRPAASEKPETAAPKPPTANAEGPMPRTPATKPEASSRPVLAERSPLKPAIVAPAEGAAFDAPATVLITVDCPGDVVKVEFYVGPTKVGEATKRPFQFPWKDAAAGEYSLTALATDPTGDSRATSPVAIRVKDAATPEPVADPGKPAPTPEPTPAPAPARPADLGIDPRRVDQAIAKGVAYLKASSVKESLNPAPMPGLGECPELILWTLVHARVPENDPDFTALVNSILGRKLERTYAVALQAMILEELNRVKYQVRIAQCAQFLMDAQCGNGQWSYGGPAQVGVPTSAFKPDVATASDPSGYRVKPKVVRKITSLRKMQEGPPTGDNSNSQYAALGLRACHDAGIVIPKVVVQRAQTWWRISQHDDELKDGEKRPAVSTGDGVPALPAGWCYGPKDHGHLPYSSMTAGAVGSVAIWNFLQDEKNWKKEATLQKGLAWLDVHFSVTGNNGPSEHVQDTRWMLYYYLYALERAGVLAATESFGAHRWYREGAEVILGAQRPDGSWLAPLPHGDRSEATNAAWDTCFAILFLKRATRPLDVASTDIKAK